GRREPLHHFLGDPLDAGTAGDERVRIAALRALFAHRQCKSAMVACELAPETVLHEPRRTLRALDARAASSAERQRSVAAPVEEEECLLPFGGRFIDRLDQNRR